MTLPVQTVTSDAKAKMVAQETKINVEHQERHYCECKTDCIERPLRNFFARQGRYIAKHPYPFMFIPLIISVCLSFGLLYFELETDTEYLVTPKHGPAKYERKVVEKYFNLDHSGNFLPNRAPMLDGFGDVIVTMADKSSMLSKDGIGAVVRLDNILRQIKAYDDGKKEFNFDDICTRWEGECTQNPIIMIFGKNISSVTTRKLTYPTYSHLFLGSTLGGVVPNSVNETVEVEYVGAIRLTYFVKYENYHEQTLANRWFKSLLETLEDYQDDTCDIVIYRSATNSLTKQFEEASDDIMPKFAAPFSLLIIFSVMSCMMNDWVRSKPWLALAGVFSAGLSLVSVFGMLSAFGVKAVPQVGLVPFLTLGVGVDNMFILISAWRRSVVEDSAEFLSVRRRVALRMGSAMKEAALSITITSLTDILAFGIGSLTDFPTVELFCLFTGLSILFAYVYCITFFAAAMVFSGWREESNRHCLAFVKVAPKKDAEMRNVCYRICCYAPCEEESDTSSQKSGEKEEKPAAASDHLIMRFFKDYFGPILMKPWAKAFILLTYIGYLVLAIWGCSQMRSGVSFQKLSNVNSYLADYYQKIDHYYDTFGPQVNVLFTDEMEYSKVETWEKVGQVMQAFENDTEYFAPNESFCWLREFLNFLKMYPRKLEFKEEKDFVKFLKYQFLVIRGYDRFKPDVNISDDGTRIVASRCYVQGLWYEKPEDLMLRAREVANSVELNVTVFQQSFIYFDQPIAVVATTLQNIGMAVGCMLLVALLLVPHPICAIWVTLAIASIVAGVIGYMTLWDVNVDFISMTYLILCIGFSVDFAVHITYGFIASDKKTNNDKAIEGLYLLGYPILQSATSTIIAIIFLCTSISYLFLSFFKTMVLVIMFGTWHSLFVLPVVLSLVSSVMKCKVPEKLSFLQSKNKDKKEEPESKALNTQIL